MIRRHTTPPRHLAGGVRRAVWFAILGVVAGWRLAAGQGGAGWVAAPDRPTVGDTVWLERTVTAAPGWRVRAGKLEAGERVEPLGDPVVRRASSPDGWVVRYPVAAWAPGAHTVSVPPIWRLGPDGRADSLPGGSAAFVITSVIPDTVRQPEPRAAIAPIRSTRRNPLAATLAVVLCAGLLAAGVRWRRRPPRPPGLLPHVPVEPEVPDARWLAAGEPKAVAARAVLQLRVAIAHTVPGANLALSTTECLAAVERARPDAPLRELRAALEQLDRVEFASAHGADVAALALRARGLAREFLP